MKKLIIKSVSLMLILILSALMLFSCDWFDLVYRGDPNGIYPDGYTGGFGIEGQSGEEIWWVETYEECLAAIEQLKAHGSTFYYDSLFVYEGDAFDVKYCFTFSGKDDRIKFGDNPFDRYAKHIDIDTYAFFDDVTIDEINYSYLINYEVYWFRTSKKIFDAPINELIVSDWIAESKNDIHIEAKYNDTIVLLARPAFSPDVDEVESFRMTPEVISEMLENGRVEIYDNK